MTGKEHPVLVDTSVWVAVLRDKNHPLGTYLKELLDDEQARICAAIVAELLQGASSRYEKEAVEELWRSIPRLESSDDLWLRAGHLGRTLREKGVTVGLMDCYLTALALDHHCAILSLDKHFSLMAKQTSLTVEEIP